MSARFVRYSLGCLAFAALVTAIACGSTSATVNAPTSPSPSPGGGADLTITITGMNGSNSFLPNPGTLKAGQTVAWRNADSTAHTATADGGSFNTGTISPGATSSPITMSTVGTFGYHCSFHPTMVGSLSVQ